MKESTHMDDASRHRREPCRGVLFRSDAKYTFEVVERAVSIGGFEQSIGLSDQKLRWDVGSKRDTFGSITQKLRKCLSFSPFHWTP